MTEPQILAQTLESYADHAGPVRTDLLEVVERGYRRRRRVKVGSIAAAVVAVAVVASLALNPFASTSALPVTPGSWTQHRIPDLKAPLRSPATVWPGAVVTVPLRTPDGVDLRIDGVLDTNHLLVSDGEVSAAGITIYSYDVVHKTFHPLTTQARSSAKEEVPGVKVTAHWVVWSTVDDAAKVFTAEVYKAPRTGGAPVDVGAAPDLGLTWYASDSGVYWTDNAPGVMHLPLAGGSAGPLPGFGDYWAMDGTTPWAVEPTAASNKALQQQSDGSLFDATPTSSVVKTMKNLDTGEQIDVVSKPDDAWLSCTPARCVGTNDADGVFVREIDGSKELAGLRLQVDGIAPFAGNDVLFSQFDIENSNVTGYIWDPFSGKLAGLPGHAYEPENGQAVTGAVFWKIYSDAGGWTVLMLNRIT